jgi:antitoxin VapB
MPKEAHMSQPRTVSLFRNGRNQAIRIPVEFELPGDKATIRKEGNTLIIEAKPKRSFLDVMNEMEPMTKEEWPDIDNSGLLPLDDIEL